MSYDLAVWREDRFVDFEDAVARYHAFGTGEPGAEPPPSKGVIATANSLLKRWPDDATLDDDDPRCVWKGGPLRGLDGTGGDWTDGRLIISVLTGRHEEVRDQVLKLARKHGLVVLLASEDKIVYPPELLPLPFPTLTDGLGGEFGAVSPAFVRGKVARMWERSWYVIVTRDDNHYYMQTALVSALAAQGVEFDGSSSSGWIVEIRDGGPDRHFHTRIDDLSQVEDALADYAAGADDLINRFEWEPRDFD
jgi:hypothetical protein